MARKKTIIDPVYSVTTCRCGAEFQVLKKVEDGSESGRVEFDHEATYESFIEHYNAGCDAPVEEIDLEVPASATPMADTELVQ